MKLRDVKVGQTFKPLNDLYYCDTEVEGMFIDEPELIEEFTDNGFILKDNELYIPKNTEVKFETSHSVDVYSINDYQFDVGEWSEESMNTDVELVNEKKLTEAPDEDGLPTDDEIRAEIEKEFEKRKADRDAAKKVKDDEKAAKVAKEQKVSELKTKAEEIIKELGENPTFEDLFNKLVPSSGASESLGGELIRAVNKLEYRWFNDGDRFFEDYGLETCGSPAAFICDNVEEFGEPSDNDIDMIIRDCAENNLDNDDYDNFIEELKERIVKLVTVEHPELLATSLGEKDIHSWTDGEEYWEDYIPRYEYELEVSDEITKYYHHGDIDVWDVIEEVENWKYSDDRLSDMEVDTPWGSYDENISISNLTREGLETIESWDRPGLWEPFIEELENEYGTPDEWEDEENEEEETESDETVESLKEDKDTAEETEEEPKVQLKRCIDGKCELSIDGGKTWEECSQEEFDEVPYEDTHAKTAKPDGDKIKSFNLALAMAKKAGKNMVYGYTTKKNPSKFFEIGPYEYDGDDNKFRKQYGANVIYVAYPDKQFVKESIDDVKHSDLYVDEGFWIVIDNNEEGKDHKRELYGPYTEEEVDDVAEKLLDTYYNSTYWILEPHEIDGVDMKDMIVHKNNKFGLEEGIVGGKQVEITRDMLVELENKLYIYLNENDIYPEDGTFSKSHNSLCDLDLTLIIDGDWKHDHLFTEHLVDEFCKKNGMIVVRHNSEEIGESDSDWYKAEHTWYIDFDSDGKGLERLSSFRKMFNN